MSIKTTTSIDITQDTTDISNVSSTKVEAGVDNHVYLTNPSGTVTGAKKEYTIVNDGIYAGMSSGEAPAWLTDIVDDLVDSSVSRGLVDYNGLVQDVRNSIDTLDVAENTYVKTVDVGDLIDGKFALELETLNVTLGNTFSTIVDRNLLLAANELAFGQRISDLRVELNGNVNSRVTEITQAYTAADAAGAASVVALTSQIADQNAIVEASADAVSVLETYVGIPTFEDPQGTGMLARISILEKQNDGVIEYITGTYDVMSGVGLEDSDPSDDELDVTAEPYATWIAADTAAGDQAQRAAHIGDVYIQYDNNNNYIKSYKFIKTAQDTSTPFSTDPEGYTWALIVDSDAQAANALAQQALDLADGKRRVFVLEPFPPYEEGDLWVDKIGTPQLIKVATVSRLLGSFVAADWAIADQQAQNFIDNTYTPESTKIKNQIDGKVEYYFYETYSDVEDGSEIAATDEANALDILDDEWTTSALKDAANGNIVYFKDSRHAYWYQSSTPAWIAVTDTSIYEALQDASFAQGAADGKVSQFYAWGGEAAPANYVINPDAEPLDQITVSAEHFLYWYKATEETLYHKPGSDWVAVPTASDGTGTTYLSVGDLLTVFDPVSGDTTNHSFSGTSWQGTGPASITSQSRFLIELENDVRSPSGSVATARNELKVQSDLYADNVGVQVQNNFGYNSAINLNGVYYNSGFGLVSDASLETGEVYDFTATYYPGDKVIYNDALYVAIEEHSGILPVTGTEEEPVYSGSWQLMNGELPEAAFDSHFWVNAEKFILKSPKYPDKQAVFTVTENGIKLGLENTEATRNEPRGPYAAATPYTKGDLVSYAGSSYVALVDVTGVTPGTDTTKWQLLAEVGSPGAPGTAAHVYKYIYIDSFVKPPTPTEATLANWLDDIPSTINNTLYQSLGKQTNGEGDFVYQEPVQVSAKDGLSALLFDWSGSVSWPVNTDINNAYTWTFSSSFAGNGFLRVNATDAEGGVNIAVNGELLNSMSGPDNATGWYEFSTNNLVVGDNTIAVWSTTADGGSINKIELAFVGATGLQGITGGYTDFLFIRSEESPKTPDQPNAPSWETNASHPDLIGAGYLWTVKKVVSAGSATTTYTGLRQIEADIVRELVLYSGAVTSLPAVPTTEFSYNFSTDSLVGTSTNWSTSFPSGLEDGKKVYRITALATGNITQTSVSLDNKWSSATVYAERKDGVGVTVTNNGDGTHTITGANGSITVSDGIDGNVPTVTNNNNGTFTIDNGAGDTVVISAGRQISVQGTHLNNNLEEYIKVTGHDDILVTGRGHRLVILDPGTNTVEHNQTYDTYTSGTAGISAVIEAAANGKVVILSTYDATSCDQRLRDALKSCGSPLDTLWSANRTAHAFIGTKGSAVKSAYEVITDSSSEVAFVTATFTEAGVLPKGYTPTKGIDYYDGANGSFVSFVYKVGADATGPFGGSFDGTTEIMPATEDEGTDLWSDTPQAAEDEVELVSVTRYTATRSEDGTVSWANNGWSTPSRFYTKGRTGTAADNYKEIFLYQNATSLPTDKPTKLQGFTASDGNAVDFSTTWTTTSSAPTTGSNTYRVNITVKQTNNTGDWTAVDDAWNGPVEITGEKGASADSFKEIFLYANGVTAPTDDVPLTGSFTTGGLASDTTTWKVSAPTLLEGEYTWRISLTIKQAATTGDWTNSDTAWGSPVRITGDKGDDGYSPIKGTDYNDGVNGNNVRVEYSADGTSNWVTTLVAGSHKYIRTAVDTNGDGNYIAGAAAKFIPEEGVEYTVVDGVSQYLHIKYSDNGTSFTANTGETLGTWIGTRVDTTVADSTTFDDYTWQKYIGTDGYTPVKGTDYDDGVDGNNVRVEYSADGLTDWTTTLDSTTHKYIRTAVDSNNNGVYVAGNSTKFVPEKGVEYDDGDDGTSSYLHIKYSDDGSSFTSESGETLGDYIGTLVDNNVEDSTTFDDYTWKKIVGEDGESVKGDRGIATANYSYTPDPPQTSYIDPETVLTGTLETYWNSAVSLDYQEEIPGDTLILTNKDPSFGWTHIYEYTGSSDGWQSASAFIVNGNQIVEGSVVVTGNQVVGGELDAGLLRTGYIQTAELSNAPEPSSTYEGTIVDSDGIKVYSDGVLRVRIGKLTS